MDELPEFNRSVLDVMRHAALETMVETGHFVPIPYKAVEVKIFYH